ncbi:MAG: hypothetical protein ACFCUG_01310 [Thiotrichales bacterium]
MLYLHAAREAWGTPAFPAALKHALEHADPAALPLQAGLAHGSHATDQPIQAMVLAADETPAAIQVRVGLFFTSVIAGCNCADDPTPVDTLSEYCEALVEIDKATAATRISLLPI